MACEDGLTDATKDPLPTPHIPLQRDLLLLASVQMMSFSGHLLSFVCLSVRLRAFHITSSLEPLG